MSSANNTTTLMVPTSSNDDVKPTLMVPPTSSNDDVKPTLMVPPTSSSDIVYVRIKNSNPWFDIGSICKLMGSKQELRPLLESYVFPCHLAFADNAIWINEPGIYQLLLCGKLHGTEILKVWLRTHLLPLVHNSVGRNIWDEYAAVANFELEEVSNLGGCIFFATCDRLFKQGVYIMDAAYDINWYMRKLDTQEDTWRTVIQFICNKRKERLMSLENYYADRRIVKNYYRFEGDDEVRQKALAYKAYFNQLNGIK